MTKEVTEVYQIEEALNAVEEPIARSIINDYKTTPELLEADPIMKTYIHLLGYYDDQQKKLVQQRENIMYLIYQRHLTEEG